jgi:PAS domain S-box-containing protein
VRIGSLSRFTILVVVLSAFSFSLVAQQRNEKRVLLLFSEYKQRSDFLELFESSVRAHVRADITFDEAYWEGSYIEEKSYEESEAETLRRRYAGLKLDLVVPIGPSAVLFAVQYHEITFPGVPVVFTEISSDQFAGKTWPGVTGAANHVGVGETIDLALRLQPDTTAVAVISPYDPPWLAITHTELSRYAGRVKEIYFVGPPGPQLFEKVAALPPHTIVLFDLALQDSGQPPLAGFDLLDAVAQRIPTYSAWQNLCLNHGCIGGAFEDNAKVIQQTAGMAARVLSGEPVDKIAVANIPGLQVRVDWRALQHWHIPESALPPGSLVLFREPTLWEQGRDYFLVAIAVIAVQALLIIALLWQRARRRKAEIDLSNSEQKFSKAFSRSPLGITIVSADDGRYIDVNEAFEFQTGWKRDEVIGRSPLEIGLWIDPDQRQIFMKQVSANGNVRDLEVRLRTKEGEVRTALGSAELIDIQGQQCVLSVIADISDRKQAEEAMTGFSIRLIEAQETERTRIARELHDDINQRLAMVAIVLKTAKQNLSISPSTTSHNLEEACERVSDLEGDIQALSHRLHSSKLEYLGLEAAALSFCDELSNLHSVRIDFRCDGVPEDLSSGVSLCLFRVLQEALHNAVKYSGVNEFEVSLTGTSHAIELRVRDSGIGFDPKRTGNGHGLGLTSMKERLRMVRGQAFIDSKPGQGTTVFASIPLIEETSTAGQMIK